MIEPQSDSQSVAGATIGNKGSRSIFLGEEHGEIAVPIEMLLVDGELDIYPEIRSQGIFQFRFDGKRLVFQAGKFVGLIPINANITIDVRPRVPLKNLEHQLIVSGAVPKILSSFSRKFDLYEKSFDGLLDMYTDALLNSVDVIRRLGLIKEYERREILTFHPKGRLNVTRIARRNSSIPADKRLACSWFDRTQDNPLNRCILTTVELLAEKYARLPREKGVLGRIRRINEAAHYFNGVRVDFSLSFLRDAAVIDQQKIPELRAYYSEPIAICKAIIENQGISLSNNGDEFALSSLLIDMSTIFEGYVRSILIAMPFSTDFQTVDGNSKEESGGGARSLFLNDGRARIGKLDAATPDLVVYKISGNLRSPEIVIDAKYKVAEPAAHRDDINQVITYATAYGTKKALLVLPSHEKTKKGLWYLGLVGDVYLYQYNFDLSADDYLAEEAQWRSAIKRLSEMPADFVL